MTLLERHAVNSATDPVSETPPESRERSTSYRAADDPGESANWIANADLLWEHRRALARTAVISLVVALIIAFLWPKSYQSSARIMLPGNSTGGAALLAALVGRGGSSLGGLGALAGGLVGSGGNTALFIDLLRSSTVSGHLIDRFDLQRIYHKRYHVDTSKKLAHRTRIVDDKKSGVITLTVTDTDPVRARDIAQGYLDELNQLVNRTSTSSARQERLFIEGRLNGVQAELHKAEQQLSDFSSTHAAIDIKEQARATVEAASRLQAQAIVEQSGLDSLRQVYGDGNVRVRSAEARIRELQSEIVKLSGSAAVLPGDENSSVKNENSGGEKGELYPSLRQLPRLAVPYANLYRNVQVQEAVFSLLTQQYELARIQEAKDVPVVSVIDAPGIPEKKSFPPRLLLALLLTAISMIVHSTLLLVSDRWTQVSDGDPAKLLARQIGASMRRRIPVLGIKDRVLR